jgi:four helix bundle protein
MEKSRHFRDLVVWSKSIAFIKCIYLISKDFPKSEIYGLTSQLRRASVSVAANIAEGQGRNNPREFYQFLGISAGSLAEVQTLLVISMEIGYIDQIQGTNLLNDCEQISKMLYKLKIAIVPPKPMA